MRTIIFGVIVLSIVYLDSPGKPVTRDCSKISACSCWGPLSSKLLYIILLLSSLKSSVYLWKLYASQFATFYSKNILWIFSKDFSRSYCIPQHEHAGNQGAALEEMNEELAGFPMTSASRVVFGPFIHAVHVADNVSTSSWCPSEVYSNQ